MRRRSIRFMRTGSGIFLLLSVGSVFAAGAALAGEIEPIGRAIPAEPAYVPPSWITQWDNPRMVGNVEMVGPEFTERSSTAVFHSRHSLARDVSCAFPSFDVACVEETSLPGDGSALGVRNVSGTKVQMGVFLFEGFGSKLGYRPSTIKIVKTDEQYNTSLDDSASARLDQETMLVPVHVLVEVPRDDVDGAGIPDMEKYAVADYYRALFDGDFLDTTSPSRTTIPGVPFGGYQYQYVDDPSDPVVVLHAIDEVRPDAIWDQCGIQFRLTGVTIAHVDDAAIDTSSDNNGSLQSLEERLRDPMMRNDTDDFQLVWGQPYSSGPVVAIVKNVGGGNGLAFNQTAGISVDRTTGVDAIVAHELGHVMGIGRPGALHPDCTGAAGGLMCEMRGNEGPIFGCDDWRVGFERNEISPCASGVCTPAEIDLPVGCSPVSHPQNLCLTARDKMSGISSGLTGNRSAIVGMEDGSGNPLSGSISTTCLDPSSLQIKANVTLDSSDVIRTQHPTRGGWTISYKLAGVTLTAPVSQDTIDVDLSLHPSGGIDVQYDTYDLHSLRGLAKVNISRIPDTAPPEIASLADISLPGCASTEPRVIPFPEASATDDCGVESVTGTVVSKDGVPLSPPIPVVPGGNVLPHAGSYTIEWVATDAAGNTSTTVTQTALSQACVAAGTSMLVHNGASVVQADGSPLPLMTMRPGVVAQAMRHSPTHLRGSNRPLLGPLLWSCGVSHLCYALGE